MVGAMTWESRISNSFSAGLEGLSFSSQQRIIRNFSPDVTHIHSVGSYGFVGALLDGAHGDDAMGVGYQFEYATQSAFAFTLIMTGGHGDADADYIMESRKLGREDARYERSFWC